jgi:hypothetical protein
MLVPTDGCDARSILHALLTRWIPLFGMMFTIETDYGSGFDSHIYRVLMEALGVHWEYAEMKHHRGIGKVERINGFIQSIIQRYNVELNNAITDPNANFEENAWDTIKLILPHIQAAINQRRPRFTTYSPNMLMFGKQLHDVSDISRILSRIQKVSKDTNIPDADQKYLHSLIGKLSKVYDGYNNDYKKYVKLSAQAWTRKYHQTERSQRHYQKQFSVNKKVLYHIGKHKVQGKWYTQWTGPWKITTKISDATRILTDVETGNQIRVSIDHLKIYNPNDQQYFHLRHNYTLSRAKREHNEKLDTHLPNYRNKHRSKDVNLDYRNNNQNNNNNA